MAKVKVTITADTRYSFDGVNIAILAQGQELMLSEDDAAVICDQIGAGKRAAGKPPSSPSRSKPKSGNFS